jgi:hypothetical protein
LHQHDVAAGSDAPHPDGLLRKVDEGVALQQQAPVGAKRGPVGLGHRRQVIPDHLIAVMDDQWRVVDDPDFPVHDRRHLGERLEVVAMGRFLGHTLEVLPGHLGHGGGDIRRADPGVPDVEMAHRRERRHSLAIGADRGAGGIGGVGRPKPVPPAGDDDAGGQALDVPLPGSRQGLVEVVETEDERALRCGETAEIG